MRELEAKASGGQPRIQARENITIGNPVADLARGMKGGFDRAAYGLAELVDPLTPNLPISPETRAAYNSNPVVRTLGITMPSRQERSQAIDQSRAIADQSTSGAIGDAIGNSIPNIIAGVATGGMSVLPAMTTQAMTSYMSTPGGVEDRATSAALAAGGEGVGRALPRAFARLAQPIRPTPAADRLIAQGVYPTPGAAAGGGWKKVEDALTSSPGLGSAITRGQREAMEQGTQLAMSQGGVRVPAGRAGYQQLAQYFDDSFRNATQPLMFDLNDQAFNTGVQNIMRQRGLDASGVDDVTRFFDNLRTNTNMPAPNPGTAVAVPGGAGNRTFMSGNDYHGMLQNLRQEGAGFRKSQDPFQRRLGEAYRDIYNLADNSLSTQGIVPQGAIDQFRNVRSQYAAVAPALKAGELNTVNRAQGIFTPEQYQSSLVNNAKQMGNKAAVRTGTLPQQQLADDMVDVLGSRYQDSGTATRAILSGAIPGASMFVDPTTALIAAGGMGAGYGIGRGIYSEPGRRFMVGGYNGQRALADALRNFSPYTGTSGAAVAPQIFNE
jgi:hypothetical protein